MIERGVTEENIEDVIEKALLIKKRVVEQDEKESGLRRILNFGHTLGHGVESESGVLYHGECVALGMIPMCAEPARERLLSVLKKMELPTVIEGDLATILQIASHDKKRSGDDISVVWVEEIGSCQIQTLLLADWEKRIRKNLGIADTEA
jgi:3-dehydroquinate synthase